jgi:hypothetical protein
MLKEHALTRGSNFFFILRGVGGMEFFWGFFPLFPMCSHHVTIRLLLGSQMVPQDVPNSSSDLSPQFNSHVLKRWDKGEHICFYLFWAWSPKRCFYWGVHNVPKKIDDGPINMTPSKKKRRGGGVECTHELRVDEALIREQSLIVGRRRDNCSQPIVRVSSISCSQIETRIMV